jgi:hypothetical protein
MRYTEYHCGVPVIKDKKLLEKALAKLAKYEDIEEEPDMDEVLRGLYKAKNHALSEYSKKRIQDGIRLIIKLANFDQAACRGLMERCWRQKQDLLKYIDQVDGHIDPVSEIRDYVEERL